MNLWGGGEWGNHGACTSANDMLKVDCTSQDNGKNKKSTEDQIFVDESHSCSLFDNVNMKVL